MAKLEQTLFVSSTEPSLVGNMPAACKATGEENPSDAWSDKRKAYHNCHTLRRSPDKLSVSEIFFEVPKNYTRAQNGSLRLFARSAQR